MTLFSPETTAFLLTWITVVRLETLLNPLSYILRKVLVVSPLDHQELVNAFQKAQSSNVNETKVWNSDTVAAIKDGKTYFTQLQSMCRESESLLPFKTESNALATLGIGCICNTLVLLLLYHGFKVSISPLWTCFTALATAIFAM